MAVYDNILELIGNTPVVRVNHLDTGPCELFVKLESQKSSLSVERMMKMKYVNGMPKASAFSRPMLSICMSSTSVGMEVSITVPM